MFKTLGELNSLLATILGLAVTSLVGAAGWIGYNTYYSEKFAMEEVEGKLAQRDVEIAEMSQDLQQKSRQIELLDTELSTQREEIAGLNDDLKEKLLQIEQLDTAIRLLKVDHRVAQIDVISQQGSAAEGDLATTLSFVEVDDQGRPLEEPRTFTVNGDLVYVESWVVKFTDDFVEMGDPLRSTSLCLFRRLFGEKQKPADGFSLDPVGSRPAAYRNGGEMSELEQEIWSRFWDYANEPGKAQEAGVRAAHGEAPFQKMMPGKRYKVLLRSSGGLTFVPEDRPLDAHADTI